MAAATMTVVANDDGGGNNDGGRWWNVNIINYFPILVNDLGNPRVKYSDPYPYPSKPVPERYGCGFTRVSVGGM